MDYGRSVSSNHPVGDWVRTQFGDGALSTVINAGIGVALIFALAGITPVILIWLERKVCAHIQARLGPMRVGWHGLLQSIADGIKLLFKEMMIPNGADRFVFYLAPFLPATASFLVLAVIPYDVNMQIVDLKVGVIYVIAVSGLGIFGLLMAGWASNNKYSLLGAMRSGAQMISYEVSIALTMLLIVMVSGTASLREIVFSQQGTMLDWWIIKLPGIGFLAFVLFLVSATAELNRGPFDIAEAESELTAGFHTEYSGITFSMFFLAEFINMMIASMLASIFFLGGFWAPHIGIPAFDQLMDKIPGVVWLFLKTYFIIFLFMWFRWSFPRPRVDQLMNLEWKFLLPVNLLMLIGAAVFIGLGWTL